MKKIFMIRSFSRVGTVFLLLFCYAGVTNVFAQSSAVDSILLKLAAEKNEDKRIDLFNNFLGNTAEVDAVLDMQNVQKVLLHVQKNKDKIIEALALSEIAYDYRAFGNTAKSLELNLKATTLAVETGNEKLLNNAALNLAHIYKDQGDYSKALPIYFSVAESSTRLKDYMVQCWAFNSLGQVYLKMNKLDSALMYAQRAYEVVLQIHDIDFSPSILKYLGSIHGKKGNRALAISYFDMAITAAQQTNTIRWKNECYTALAQYYYDINQNDSAIVYAKKAIAVVEKTAFSNKCIEPAKLLLEIYKSNNSDSALKYSEIYRVANDSVFSTKTIQQTQALTFENELKQKELVTLKIKAENQRRQNIQYALIALGIVTFVILFFLLSHSIVVTEKWISFFGVLGLLIVFEFINLLIHPSLASVTHESPILMLFALVLLASLLIPLHHRMEKWIKEKMTEKNKKIRLENAKKTIKKLEGQP
jgi:tetratricopeptide (TPR) repeat protein